MDITDSTGTLVKSAIFSFASFGSALVPLITSMSGCIPILLISCTLCWVGFVFISPTTESSGARLTCMNSVLFCPSSILICLKASRNGRLSMSPTVPPHSTTMTSTPELTASSRILLLISSVMCGIIWTDLPRNLPFLSSSMTFL